MNLSQRPALRGDLIVSIEVPACAEGRASHYLKVRDRQSYEFAPVSHGGPRSRPMAGASARRGSPWAAWPLLCGRK